MLGTKTGRMQSTPDIFCLVKHGVGKQESKWLFGVHEI